MAPQGTREWLLICEDPDAPREQPFVHWVVIVPKDAQGLNEGASENGLPYGARELMNDHGGTSYFGPRPPKGHGIHHYHFQLFALDTHLDLDEDFDRRTIVDSLTDHTLGFGELIGIFESA